MFSYISNLKLNNFRNYQHRNFNFSSKNIAFYGSNGVGKTNILEAISILCKGRGLKNSDFDEMLCFKSSGLDKDQFGIFAKIENHPEIENIGTLFDKNNRKKIFQINGQKIGNNPSSVLPTVIWLTPQMDNLFYSSKQNRRNFLDKIVSDINSDHQSMINSYDKNLRERINLLCNFEGKKNDIWLDIIEQNLAENAIAIASARNEALEVLNKAILDGSENFTKAKLEIIGETENHLLEEKAIMVEENYKKILKNNRVLDAKSKRTNFGIHRSDLNANLIEKNIPANLCSTGEQKSILIAITFARIRLCQYLNQNLVILLLDEIISHLDDKKRKNLLSELNNINCQSFLSATHKEFYQDLFLDNQTEFLEIF